MEMEANVKVVVLLSGGIDSTTAAYLAKAEGYEIHALSLIYGQKAKPELEASKRTASKICASHKIVDVSGLKEIWESPLINMDIKPEENDRKGDSYYVVPLRNIVFTSIAAAYAETIGARFVVIGNQEEDVKGFPDCGAPAMKAMNEVFKVASEAGKKVSIWSPWQTVNKEEIIRRGLELGVPYEDTYSCYDDEVACGVCESCQYRLAAFKAAGVEDPIQYRNK